LLFLLLSFARLLATSAGDKVLILAFAGESLALWELLAGTLVWLADFKATAKLELFLGLFSKILLEALGLDFRLLRFLRLAVSRASLSIGNLFVSLGNILTGLFVLPLSITSCCTPSVSNLLLVIANTR
jgi:hypothetical protein